jgi:hypothetical protein
VGKGHDRSLLGRPAGDKCDEFQAADPSTSG